MLPAVIRFQAKKADSSSRQAIEDRAEGFLGMLWKNGQIQKNSVLGWKGSVLSAYVGVPAVDSLEDHFGTPWVAEFRAALLKLLCLPPEWEILADAPSEPPPSWESARGLLLGTSSLGSSESPLWHGETGTAIPVYTLPMAPSERESLQFWAEDFRRAYGIWISSSTPEASAYRLIADLRSPLVRAARELASRLQEATGKEVFAFIPRHYALDREERLRPCPLCGGEWKQRPARHDPLRGLSPSFRCDGCRIASEMGVDESEPALARIGTFHARSHLQGRKSSA